MKPISYYFKRPTKPEHVDSELRQEDEMEQGGEIDGEEELVSASDAVSQDAGETVNDAAAVPSRKRCKFNADWQKAFPCY